MEFDKNIPIPAGRRRARWGWLKEMKPGDSKFQPLEYKDVGSFRAAVSAYLTDVQFKFTTRVLEEDGQFGVRVWCI